jgi:putative selenium metabolism hydrolase
LTAGETGAYALQQIRDLPAVKEVEAQVSMYNYDQPSYTGLVYPTDSYFPAWTLEEDHSACQTLVAGYKSLFGKDPIVDKWTFSTNGVAITGMSGIPCIGFGPGHEDQAHAPNEKTWKSELVQSAAMYAIIPATYVQKFVRD